MENERRVPVVDDDGSVRQSLGRPPKSVGYAVDLFGSGDGFRRSGRASGTDCLILDVRMPGMTGFELYRLDAVRTAVKLGAPGP